MKSMMTAPAPHLEDDELLRLIDEDGDAQWRAEKESHVAMCEQCANELQALRADQQLVHTWIDAAAFEADFTPRRSATTRFPRTAWLRAAAVLFMIGAPVAALPGLRALIADTVTSRGTPADVRTMSLPEVATEAAVIRFVPAAGTFTVALDAAQRDGVLRIRQAPGEEAILEAQLQAGAPIPEPVFGESALRVRNVPESAHSYTLMLPSSVTRVIVTLGGAQVAELGAAVLREGITVPLVIR
jgi:hypothetical protein